MTTEIEAAEARGVEYAAGRKRRPRSRAMLRATWSGALRDPRDGSPFAVHAGQTLLAPDHPVLRDPENLRLFEPIDATEEMKKAWLRSIRRGPRPTRRPAPTSTLPAREPASTWRLP